MGYLARSGMSVSHLFRLANLDIIGIGLPYKESAQALESCAL